MFATKEVPSTDEESHEVKVVPFELKCQYSPDLLQQSLKQASTSLAFRRDRQVLARYCYFNDYSRIPSALEYCSGYVVTQQRRREISCTCIASVDFVPDGVDKGLDVVIAGILHLSMQPCKLLPVSFMGMDGVMLNHTERRQSQLQQANGRCH